MNNVCLGSRAFTFCMGKWEIKLAGVYKRVDNVPVGTWFNYGSGPPLIQEKPECRPTSPQIRFPWWLEIWFGVRSHIETYW